MAGISRSCLALVAGVVCCWPAGAQSGQPAAVTIAGSLQSELGCPGDWQPDCTDTQLGLDPEDAVWQGILSVPAGDWEYKAPIDGGWDENYGANAQPNGANIGLSLPAAMPVKFYYSHETHWVTDDYNTLIATAPGNFQSELGCAGDWDPGCLRSWLQDPDGNDVHTFRTARLPAGSYEAKVALNESWEVNYGAGGVQNGPNVGFTVATDCAETEFAWDAASHVLSIAAAPPAPQPTSVTVAGSLQSELGCPGDWQPNCAATHLAFDPDDAVWQATFAVPAGNWEYKAPLDDSWDENYGAHAQRNGANIGLNLGAATDVKFYFSRTTNWITDSVNSVIAVAPGSFQSELGCAGDWDPGCLRSWLQDPDGDGTYGFSARLPAGDYEVKVAHDESWDVNYGDGGAQNGANIPFSVTRACALTHFSYDAASHVLTIGSAPGGPKGDLRQARAHWIDRETLAWNAGDAGSTFRLHHHLAAQLALDETGVAGGDSMALAFQPGGLTAAQRARFPHLAGYHALKIVDPDLEQTRSALQGQLAVSAVDAEGNPIDATGVQIPGVLDDLYTHENDLGVIWHEGQPSIALWAPTAQSVSLHLFDDSDPATTATVHAMTRDPATGVWRIEGTPDWDRRYYLFEVRVYAPSTRAIETNLVTDPYSLSLAADSTRSQIVNLDDPDLQPKHWARLHKPRFDAPEDMVLYELHVRDFSIRDSTVPTADRGTFNAFTQKQSDGMRHLKRLAQAGVSHVHLLPSFDIATVPERRADQQTVDETLLATYAPDSEQQQAAVAAIKDADGFNWGYDPWHYTVPEGSYATNPDGTARIREFRNMVEALNRAGLRVVMDVVYNHTTAAGQNSKSVLDRVVPGYYHRLNGDGDVEMSTCCANTATEHAMMERLMIDSVVTWARAYKVDGFRFDLMGHHSKSSMLKLRAALDALTERTDGIDGREIYLYGEGWNFGEVANNARFEQATQRNMAGTGIGTFSDRLRDGVRGGNPFGDVREQGFINGLATDPSDWESANGDDTAELFAITDWIRVGLAGDIADYQLVNAAGQLVRADQIDYFGQAAGYTADPQENISYIAAHDNETLFDVDQLKLPAWVSMDDRVRVQTLGNALVMLGQGIPFLHAGQEFLRSKSMDRDSFNSGDWFNAIDWTQATSNWGNGLPIAEKNEDKWPLMAPLLADPTLAPGPEYRERTINELHALAKIRRSSPLFRLRTGQQVRDHLQFHNTGPDQVPGLIVMTLNDPAGAIDDDLAHLVTLFNARTEAVTFEVPGLAGMRFELHEVLRGLREQPDSDVHDGQFHVPPRSYAVYVARR